MNRIAAVIAGLSLAFVGTSASISATINVPGDYTLIQDAINASSDGDTIAIAAGTYDEHSINTNNKAITIGSASGNLDVTIDAQQGGSVFVINSGEGSGTEIKDLVITGGNATHGGGIYCWGSNPTISGCTISGNTAASRGGGIWCYNDSNPTISNCTIKNNIAYYYGGGIFCWNSSNPTISNCTIKNNIGRYGGGIYCYGSNPTISGCTISGNNAILIGGGIYCYNYSNPTITGCTISGNTATPNYDGGGIYCEEQDNPTISDSQICGNAPDQIYGDYEDDGGNTVADECPVDENCPADADDNGVVDVIDLLAVIDGWGTDSSDMNGDGTTDVLDLLVVIDGWGPCP